MDARQKQAATFAVKLVVTLVPAYFVYRNIVGAPDWDVNDLFRLFSMNSVRPFLLALLCLGVSNFSACLQWKLLLERQGVHMGYGHLLKLYYVGLFFNNFMPGNVGGDVKKVYDIRMQGGQDTVGAGLTATAFDRLYGLFFVTLFALAMGALFFGHDEAQRAFLWPSVWIFLGFCGLFAGLCSRRLGNLCCLLMSKFLPERIQGRVIHMFNRFRDFRSLKLWIQISLLSAVTQSLRILVHYFCGIAVGVDLSISWYFYYIPLVAIVSALPISIGGFGPREFLAQSLFARAGVASLESVVIQLLAYFVSLLLSLFGAFAFLLGGKPDEAVDKTR
ncbi:lysylphosphatidylglycerol synthase transmembrane domain-containing protein [uncultured Fibrobacter sp.]|uniref:lysylphosphatidylglycerol synthase transmembrane domain-containing protein n=1 Tax=uncultured Fibrobacter sp. TaxID=261512 RepID=UPI0025DCC9DC|nr:lysylphosphatidylglycerol synthase transmembrane domain-containing protein [uncultured Fibrobacter sp.]